MLSKEKVDYKEMNIRLVTAFSPATISTRRQWRAIIIVLRENNWLLECYTQINDHPTEGKIKTFSNIQRIPSPTEAPMERTIKG